ncbi:hypothetical protein LCGC14_2947070, partial [marine sediment metagenome]
MAINPLLFESPEQEDADNVLPIAPEAQQKLTTNHDRIQNNIQGMINANAPFSDINKYLRVEGIELDIQKEDTQRETEDVNAKTLSLSFIRGSIKGTYNLAALPFLATDAIGYGVRRIFDEDAEIEAVISGKISQTGTDLAKLFDPNFTFERGQEDLES